MLKPEENHAPSLYVYCSLEDLVPDDHVLKQLDRRVDFSWIRDEVRHLYCPDNGRPGIDPERALRLMVAGFFEGITEDRKLCRRATTDIAFRWFARLTLQDSIPNHSSFTRLRQRWGVETFQKLFERALAECSETGLVNSDTVHVDSTLIRANVSWNRVIRQHVEQVARQSDGGEADSTPGERICETDPDASLATSSSVKRPEPSYKQHVAVNDNGVVVALEVTTGAVPEGEVLMDLVNQAEELTGERVANVTADRGYASAANYEALEDRGINAVVPPKVRKSNRFSYDSLNEALICPRGRKFGGARETTEGRDFNIKASECTRCKNFDQCFKGKGSKTVTIRWGIEALQRAERKKAKGWDDADKQAYARHWNLVEGVQGEMKNEHGLIRAVRRGLHNMWIQALMTATVINLKRALKAFFGPLFDYILSLWAHRQVFTALRAA